MPRKNKIIALNVPVERKPPMVMTGPPENHIICLKLASGTISSGLAAFYQDEYALGSVNHPETQSHEKPLLPRHVMETTHVSCWHCCHPFDTIPCFLPLRYTSDSKFQVKGCFCSYNCVLAYAYEQRYHRSIPLVNYLYRKLNKLTQHHHIKRAPPRETLASFGGTMSIQEFRANFINNTRLSLIHPPLISMNDTIESYETKVPTSVRPEGKIDLDKIKQQIKKNHGSVNNKQRPARSPSPINLEKLMGLRIS